MTPAPNPFKTVIFTAPQNFNGECGDLEVFVDKERGYMISCWEPDEEEIAAINRGEKIWMYIGSRGVLPITALSVGERPL